MKLKFNYPIQIIESFFIKVKISIFLELIIFNSFAFVIVQLNPVINPT